MPTPRLSWCLLVLALLGGCGSAGEGQDRPLVVAVSPSTAAPVTGPVSVLRVEFDDPVSLFDLGQVALYRDGVWLPLVVTQRPDEPSAVRLRPASTLLFPAGTYDLYVLEGLVLNEGRHYALEPYHARLVLTPGSSSVFVASPASGSVTELDPLTQAVRSVTLNAPGTTVEALAGVRLGATTHVYAQLTTGSGTGRALARYAAGDAAMTTLPLTTSGGDLTSPASCLVVAPDGEFVYAAFRDVSAQQVRLARVRVVDGVETGSLLLSPPADADCAPTALALADAGATLLVLTRRAGTPILCRVARETFVEVDRDGSQAGVQGATLASAPGPAAVLGSRLVLAPEGAVTADAALVLLSNDALTPAPSTVPGLARRLTTSPDGTLLVCGLAAGTPDEHLTVRSSFSPTTDAPFVLSDDVGGVDQGANLVRDLATGDAYVWALLDANLLARLSVVAGDLEQDDLDLLTPGVQAHALAGPALGATRLGVVRAAFP